MQGGSSVRQIRRDDPSDDITCLSMGSSIISVLAETEDSGSVGGKESPKAPRLAARASFICSRISTARLISSESKVSSEKVSGNSCKHTLV